MYIPVSITDTKAIRAASKDPNFQSGEIYKSHANGHKYKVGETRTLTGLAQFPEYNGQQVKITAIREDGSNGRAYYIEGKVNEMLNWIYEYRLE